VLFGREPSSKQVQHRFSFTIPSDIERPLFDFICQPRRNAQSVINRRVQILNDHALLKRLTRPLF